MRFDHDLAFTEKTGELEDTISHLQRPTSQRFGSTGDKSCDLIMIWHLQRKLVNWKTRLVTYRDQPRRDLALRVTNHAIWHLQRKLVNWKTRLVTNRDQPRRDL